MGTRHGATPVFVALMLEHGYSARELAKVAGVSPRSVTRAEAGEALPEETRAKLAAVLGDRVYDAIPIWHRPPRHPTVAAHRRSELGWTVADAARLMGISPGTLKRAEAGRPVLPSTAKRIADAYGVSPLEIPSTKGHHDAVPA